MKKLFLIALILIILFPILNAKIVFFNDNSSIYNVGSLINTNFSLEPQEDFSGYIEEYLICNNEQSLIFKQFKKIPKNKKEFFLISFIASNEGECFVRVNFGKESEISNSFEISNKITILFDINDNSFYPLERISVNGTITKKSGENFSGTLKISLNKSLNYTIESLNGSFYFQFNLPEKINPGEYILEISCYEKDFYGEVLNFGSSKKTIYILSKPSLIKISSNESFKPPQNILITAKLLDLNENEFSNETILIKIFDPNNKILATYSKKSGEDFYFYFPENSLKGCWRINAYYGSIFSTKPIFIEENKKIQILIEDNKGINITNIGNVDYQGVIEVFFENSYENKTFPININLSIGDSELVLPELNGRYNVSVSGEFIKEANFSSFTGGITGGAIFENKKKNISPDFYLFFVFIIIFILIFFIYLIIKKRIKNKKDIQKKLENKNLIDSQNKINIINPVVREIKPIIFNKFYLVVFNTDNFDKLKDLLNEKGLHLRHLEGSFSFILVKSKEELCDKLATLIIKLRPFFQNTSLIFHLDSLDENSEFINRTFSFKEVLKSLKGFFITQEVYLKLSSSLQRGFIKDKNFTEGKKLINLYRLL